MSRTAWGILFILTSFIYLALVPAVEAGDYGLVQHNSQPLTGQSNALPGLDSSISANAVVLDNVLVQRWEEGVANPGGTAPGGWFDWVGDQTVFDTMGMVVTWGQHDVLIQIYTNMPELGEGFGPTHGYVGNLWQPADLVIDLDQDGIGDMVVPLIDHGAIPADPDPSDPDPPGYGQPTGSFLKGTIYRTDSATQCFSSDDIHKYHYGYGGLYDMSNPTTPCVWARLGTAIGTSEITWNNTGTTDPTYRVDVLLQGVYSSDWDKFSLFWGTANCANDAIAGSVVRQPPATPPTPVPTLQQWGYVLLSLLIFTAGLVAVGRRRSHIE